MSDWIIPPTPPEPERRTSFFIRVFPRRSAQATNEAPLDEAERSRRKFEALNERAEVAAGETVGLEKRLRAAEEDLRNFIQNHPRFAGSHGRRIVMAFLFITFFPLISAFLDVVLMVPVVEWFSTVSGFPLTPPVRIAGSFAMTALLYLLGAKIGMANQDRDRGAVLLWTIISAIAIAFFGAVGLLIGLEEGGSLRVFPPVLMGVLLPSVAIFAGRVVPDSLDYITFLIRLGLRTLRIDRLQRAYISAGNRAVRLFHRLQALRNRHRRRFGEDLEPLVSENLRRVVEIFSTGRYHIVFSDPVSNTAAAMPTPPTNADHAGGRTSEAASPSNVASVVDSHVNGEASEGGSEEYLRQQLQQVVHWANQEVRPNNNYDSNN